MRGRLIATLVALGLIGAWPARAQPLLERQTLTGDWNGVRPALSSHGIDLYLTYTATLWGNAAGGHETGARWNGYLDFGVEFDLSKLGAWDGLGIHADFHWWQGGRPTGELIGGVRAMALSGWEAAATLRVYNLYLRQALADGRVVLKLGQLAADTDFMVSRYGGVFLNAGFGDLPSQNLNLDAPVYPLAAPGLVVQGSPTSWLTTRFGAYTGDAGDDVAGNHGFGWEIGTNAGGSFFTEIAAARAGKLAGRYTLGGIFDTGGSAQFGTREERRSHYELYMMVDQALIEDDKGKPVLAAFARLGGSPQDARNVVSVNADAGLTWFGPIPSRADDVLGLAVSLFRFTGDFQRQSRATFGPGETVLEVTYQVAIAPWLVVQPDAQFFFDPAFSARNAQALGIELVAIF
jgi:porin